LLDASEVVSGHTALTPIPVSFASRIVAWQRTHGRRDLPWQTSSDAYRIWLSEIMLQQTQVATVVAYFNRFVAEFAAVDVLAAAPLSRVLELWSGLGYYRRAHHLHAAARVVVATHGGRFPDDAATLAALPGVGRSTAAAIAAFAHGERGAILDGNVKRVLARHRGIEGWPGAPKVEARLWRAAEALLPPEHDCACDAATIGAYTQGMMDLGATLCTRSRPRCEPCPVRDDCVARRDARIGALPSPRPRKTLPTRAVTVLLLERNGKVLLEQRPTIGIWGGLWSFPELPVDADVAAHVLTRFHADAEATEALPPLAHAFTHFALTMHPIRVRVPEAPDGVEMPGCQWFGLDEAIVAAIPAPVRKLLAEFRNRCDAAASRPLMLGCQDAYAGTGRR
jgi:A/G-specific adenine glycosylase